MALKDLDLAQPIAKGANAVVYAANFKDTKQRQEEDRKSLTRSKSVLDCTITKYPLAVKMMFNYDIQSNAFAILNAMYRETIPARFYYSNAELSNWEIELVLFKRYLLLYNKFLFVVCPTLRGTYHRILMSCRCLQYSRITYRNYVVLKACIQLPYRLEYIQTVRAEICHCFL